MFLFLCNLENFFSHKTLSEDKYLLKALLKSSTVSFGQTFKFENDLWLSKLNQGSQARHRIWHKLYTERILGKEHCKLWPFFGERIM